MITDPVSKLSEPIVIGRYVDPTRDPRRPQKEWEFDSHMTVRSRDGSESLRQVWRRDAVNDPYTSEWTLTFDTPGAENKPPHNAGCWTSSVAFQKAFPDFGRLAGINLYWPNNPPDDRDRIPGVKYIDLDFCRRPGPEST